ncbi:TPA: type IV secretion system DNA-binding domain-containing protein [Serratia marcescens]
MCSICWIGGQLCTDKRPFNLRDWVHTEDMNGDNGWIFITSDGRHHEALKPLLTAWLHMLMVNVLGLRPDNGDRERRIWLLLDELPSLHKLPISGSITLRPAALAGPGCS